MDKPLVSIITPTFNRPHLLERALNSVQKQTYKNFEIIVINDGEIDVSDILSKFKDHISTKYICTSGRMGLPHARNTGIKSANGTYIAYLDDDDLFLPNHLEELVNVLLKNNKKVAYANSVSKNYKVETNNKELIFINNHHIYNRAFEKPALFVDNYIPVIALMHEKKCFETTGPFDETLESHEDWDLWIRLALNFDFIHVPKITSEITRIENGSSITDTKVLNFKYTRALLYKRYYDKMDDAVKQQQFAALRKYCSAIEQFIIIFKKEKHSYEIAKDFNTYLDEILNFFTALYSAFGKGFIASLSDTYIGQRKIEELQARIKKIESPFIRFNFPKFLKL